MINDCLGIGLNCSNYNFTFSIIDFLTIVGLFFAGYQLIKPVHKLRLSYYGFFKHWTELFCLIALLCTLIPIVLKFIPGKAVPLIGYDIFWELLGIIIILITGIITFIWAVKPIKKVKNIEKLSSIVVFYLGQGKKRTEALGQEFGNFIGDIVKKIDNGDDEAYKVLLLCKNKNLINNIITDNVASFYDLLEVYAKRKLTGKRDIEYLHKDFIGLVINESLNNNDSILSKEIKGDLYNGFNNGKGIISQIIFNDFKFIHDYDLLDRNGYNRFYYNGAFNEVYGENYQKFWELCVFTFFGKWNETDIIKKNIRYYDDLGGGLYKFSGYKGIIYNRITSDKYCSDILSYIEHGIYNDKSNEILKSKADNSVYYKVDFGGFHPIHPPKDFIEAISWGCYMGLQSVARVDENNKNTETIRDYCRMLYFGNISSNENVLIKEIENNIKALILGQIKYSNSYGRGPNMTRIFFHIFGREIFFQNKNIDRKEQEFIIKVLKIISESLESFSEGCFWNISKKDNKNLDNDILENRNKKVQEIIDNFLPKYMSYSYEKKTLTYYSMSGIDKSVLDLTKLKNNKIVLLNPKK